MISPVLETPELLFRCAQQMQLNPVWLTPLDVFSITIDGKEQYINFAHSPLNSDVGVSLAKNKYVTRRILEKHAMENIPFILPGMLREAEAFMKLHETIVAKPVAGAGGRDIHIITELAQLVELQVNEYILEKYIAGQELRYLLLDGKIVGVHRSEYGTSVSEDRLLERISYPQALWDPALVALSQRIADVLNLKFAAIDYLIDASGRVYILEVNTMPGFKWFHAPSSGPVVDIARLFLESIVEKMRVDTQQRRYVADLLPGLALSR